MDRLEDVAAAIRQIARGFQALADAISRDPDQPPEPARIAALVGEWGDRGLTRAEASALFRKHGFAPQIAGGWTRGGWIETRADNLRTPPTAPGNGSLSNRTPVVVDEPFTVRITARGYEIDANGHVAGTVLLQYRQHAPGSVCGLQESIMPNSPPRGSGR